MVYRWLTFELDTLLYELRHDGARVKLEPRV